MSDPRPNHDAGTVAAECPEADGDLLDPEATWRAVTDAAACVWWQLTTIVEATGPDAVTFLDAMCTQAIAQIPVGQGRHALFLDRKASILAATIAWRAADQRVLLEVEPQLADELVAWLLRYRLRSKVEFGRPDMGIVSVVGPAAAELAGDGWFESPLFGVPARTFIGGRSEAATLVRETLPARGIRLADPESIDALRIVAGVPWLNDMPPGRMPAEVGGTECAVAFDKGCYIGQEPVARLHYKGHANRLLRQLLLSGELDDDGPDADQPDGAGSLSLWHRDPASGAGDARRQVGTVTSWAMRPGGDVVALGIVRREIDPSELLEIAGGSVHARIAELSLAN